MSHMGDREYRQFIWLDKILDLSIFFILNSSEMNQSICSGRSKTVTSALKNHENLRNILKLYVGEDIESPTITIGRWIVTRIGMIMTDDPFTGWLVIGRQSSPVPVTFAENGIDNSPTGLIHKCL
jgi:hypothetical protein